MKKGKGLYIYIFVISLLSVVVVGYTYQYNRVLSLSYDIKNLKNELAELQLKNQKLKKNINTELEQFLLTNQEFRDKFSYPGEDQVIWVVYKNE
jgi:cell division protein FtsB